MQVTALNNQSLIDIAIQTTGSADNLLKIAMKNNLVASDPIAPGTILSEPENVEIDKELLTFYEVNSLLPATEIPEDLRIVELSCEDKLYECFK